MSKMTKTKSRIIATIFLLIGLLMIGATTLTKSTDQWMKMLNSIGIMFEIVAAFMYASSGKLDD